MNKMFACASLCFVFATGLAPSAVAAEPVCYPPSRFTMSANEVYDAKTKLTWQRELASTTKTREEAFAYCAALGQGFRLPSVKELVTIIDHTQTSPAINSEVFLGSTGGFWTSTALPGSSSYWYVYVYEGIPYHVGGSVKFQVRCVR